MHFDVPTIAYPVRRITNPGMTLRLASPFLPRDSHRPKRPAHHQMTPIDVCWISLCAHSWPHRCSVKVLTHPHAAITAESQNSWDLLVLRNQLWPTSNMMHITIPYPMNELPMIKCAKHCPKWSARQNPSAVIPPKSICTHETTGIALPQIP